MPVSARYVQTPINPRPSNSVNDGLTEEEIAGVRGRCKRMVEAAATAGGPRMWMDARKALLATVFETHPNLDEADLQKYLAVRGLVSATIQRIDTGNQHEGGTGSRCFGAQVRVSCTQFGSSGAKWQNNAARLLSNKTSTKKAIFQHCGPCLPYLAYQQQRWR